ncbi:helix-turn-helix transcriptional regulator [Haladaptatus salinisoli]|uniref:helix-turn-helix transcriptional regulator n=1 Tax=Haladaptatus salinisoli TaxID=2884876 RepID=UPI001D09AE4F|nr:helix-turn-helix domain-containing protein [Haladaptatus salinisoli]
MRLVGRRSVAGSKLIERLRRAISRVNAGIVGAKSAPAGHGERDASESAGGRSMADFALETGVTPEEYVVSLLEERGGNQRQQAILAETGLNRSSVSRLLREMEANGRIRRVRLGAENHVYLPDAAPDLAGPEDPASTADI